jgi:phosphatidylserine/phosphatidylglycerophosphate/cardiolipin synthase-like enzyme
MWVAVMGETAALGRARGHRARAVLSVKLVLACVAGLLAVALSSPSGPASARASDKAPGARQGHHAHRWMPPRGAAFNIPWGNEGERTHLMRRIVTAVRHTRRGETIRFAMYSFDRQTMADALIAAHRRGVHVQMVVNDNWTSAATNRLKRALGTNPRRRHFVVICHQSCRGGHGNVHLKVYSFTRAGGARHVLMTGSTNITRRAVDLQWNDLYTLYGDRKLFSTWVTYFNQLSRDRPVHPRRIEYTSRPWTASFTRTAVEPPARTVMRSNTGTRDPVLRHLRHVTCRARSGTGVHGRTVLRIMMYAWYGQRGTRIADRVAYLARHGCDVRAILNVASGTVRRLLSRAGIPMRSAAWDYTLEHKPNIYSHLKVYAVNGTYHGRPTRTVWTGSENWSPIGFINDEITLQVNKGRAERRYMRFFRWMWNGRSTHAMGLHPTSGP